jgi:hypothetical protein
MILYHFMVKGTTEESFRQIGQNQHPDGLLMKN